MSFCLQLSSTLARTLIRNLLYSGQIFKILRETLDLYQMYGMLPYYYKYQTLSNSDQQPSGGHHILMQLCISCPYMSSVQAPSSQ